MAFSFLQRLRWISIDAVVVLLATQQSSTMIRQNRPMRSLELAKHLAWLDNWAEASRVLDEMRASGRLVNDQATKVFAKAVEVRGNIESLSLPAAASELSTLLATGAAQNDPQLRLQILTMKGDVEFQYDLPAAEQTWSDVEKLAAATGQDAWVARSSGELGCIAFLNGEVYTAMKKVVAAYFRAEVSGDIAEKMKTLTALGEGLAEFGRPADALRFFNRVLALSAENPDAYFPFTAYLGKARLLLESNPAEGRRMLLDGLEAARRQRMRVREARILIALGRMLRDLETETAPSGGCAALFKPPAMRVSTGSRLKPPAN